MSLVGSLETLNPMATCGPNTTDSVFSATTDGATVPLFLQDKGTLGGTKELLEKVQVGHMLSARLSYYSACNYTELGCQLSLTCPLVPFS